MNASKKLMTRTVVKRLAELFVSEKWTLVWCGMGSGVAGAVARGALEAGGKATAIVVDGLALDGLPANAERMATVRDFRDRQGKLFQLGDAMLVLPGGIGTLGELNEIAGHRAVGLYTKPVVALDPKGWFDPLQAYLVQADSVRVLPSRPETMFVTATTVPKARDALTLEMEGAT